MKIQRTFLALLLVFAMMVMAVPGVAAAEEEEGMTGASITLGADITLNLFAALTGDAADYTVEFTMNGSTETVRAEATPTSGEYVFRFCHIGPQCMNDAITAVLKKGDSVIDTSENYYAGGFTVVKYCESLLTDPTASYAFGSTQNMDKSQPKLQMLNTYMNIKALIGDLLAFGTAAQKYTGHNTDRLASDALTVNTTRFTAPSATDKAVNNKDGGIVTFRSANLWFENTVRIRFTYTASSTENLVLKINDTVVTPVANADGSYYVETTDINATGFATVYTVAAYVNGEQDSAATYSVRSYVNSKKDADGNIADLVKTLWNYGESARKYASAFTVKERGGFTSMDFDNGIAQTPTDDGQLPMTTNFTQTKNASGGTDNTLQRIAISAKYPDFIGLVDAPAKASGNLALRMTKSKGGAPSGDTYNTNDMYAKFTSNTTVKSTDSTLIFQFSMYVDYAALGVDNGFNTFLRLRFENARKGFYSLNFRLNTEKAATFDENGKITKNPATGFSLGDCKTFSNGLQYRNNAEFDFGKWYNYTVAVKVDTTDTANPVFLGASVFVDGVWLYDSMNFFSVNNVGVSDLLPSDGTFAYATAASGEGLGVRFNSVARGIYNVYFDDIIFYELQPTYTNN